MQRLISSPYAGYRPRCAWGPTVKLPTGKGAEWKNRIVGHGEEPPDQLLAHPQNFRVHPAMQQSALAGSLDGLGWIQEVIVNKRTGHMIDGHLRVALALRSGAQSIPVAYVDLDEAEEAQALLSLDPIAAMASTDKDNLDALLRQVQTDDERVMEYLADLAKDNGLDYGQPPQGDAEPEIDRAEELREKWGVETGQLWRIGDHRLICGDCTDRAVVDRVMGGEKAEMVFTDPPYGVDYHGNFIHSGKILDDDERIWKDGIENDEEDFSETIKKCFMVVSDVVSPGGVCMVCAPAGRKLKDFLNLWPDSWHYQVAIVWNKQSLIISRWDYHPQHEIVLFGWIKGERHQWFGGTKQSTVWDIPRHQGKGYKHPTEKPIELYQRGIENHTKITSVVYEPFAGSGTALVACQNLSRKCRAIEISPAYCAVILERMATAFPGIEIAKVD